MNNIIQSYLSELNLSEREVTIYQTGLGFHHGQKTSNYAKITGINRTTTHSILEQLVKKGFFKKIPKQGITLFYAVPIEEVIKKSEERLGFLKELLPTVNQLLVNQEDKFSIHYYEGLHTIIGEYEQILQYNSTLYSFIGHFEYNKKIDDYLNILFFPKKERKKIKSKTLAPENHYYFPKKEDEELLKERKICNKITLPNDIIINLYGEKYTMIINLNKDNHYMTIITSDKIYQFLKSIHQLLWIDS